MAQSGYTPILIYASGTASNVPLAANLTSSASGAELALNYADGKLYFKNSSGVVTLLAGAGGAGVVAGSNTQIQFNNSGVFGASANLTWDGSKVTASAYQTGGNLTFTGTGNRITGDFTNATLASRVAFQTSTVNGSTTITVIPNGTGLSSQLGLYGSSDPANAAWLQIAGNANSGTEHRIAGTLTGTGTYLPITFFTGGSERMRLDTSGNVGIGTSSPDVKLQINGIIKSGATGTNGEIQLARTSDGLGVGKVTMTEATQVMNYNNLLGSGIHSFTINATERMRIDSSGNVGIGTSSPTQKLDVNGIGRMRFSSGTGAGHYLDTTGNASRFFVGTDAVTEAWRVYDSIGGANRIYLDSSGNVGIGTASPAGKLEVSGGRSWFTANSELYSIAFRYSSSTGVMYMGATNSVSTPSIQFSNSGGTALATIDYSGNLLLGTTSGSARLVVNGGTSTSQIRWEVNNAAFVNEVSTNAAASAYVYKSNDALYHVWKISSSTAMVLDTSGRMYMSANAAYGNAKITLVPATNPTTGLSTNSQIQIGEATSNPAYCLNIGYGLFGDYYGYIQSKNNSLATSLLLNPDGGNVGIGTSAPSGKLDVRTAAGTSAVMNLSSGSNATVTKFSIQQIGAVDWDIGLTATNGHFAIGGLGGTMAEAYKIVRTGTAIDYQTWNTGGTERMRIDSSGNVNIGSAATTAAAGGRVFDIYNLENTNSSSYALTRLITYNVAGTTTVSADIFKDKAGSFVFNNNETNAAANTSFGIGGTERMRIDSSGNVGIGTSAPSGKLEVSSSGQNIVVSRSTGSYAAYQRTAPTGQQTYDFYTINGVEVARITGDPTYLGFSTGLGTERMRIDSSGNVGIGTGSPSSYGKFAVIGSGTTASTFSVVATDNAGTSNFTVRDDGLVTANKPAGLGYGTGSGGTVTQATSKSTGVTLNKPTGQITMNAAALGAGASVIFLLTNSLLAATDSVIVQPNYGANSQSYAAQVTFSGTGGAYIRVTNISGGSLSEAVTLSFAIIKGATA